MIELAFIGLAIAGFAVYVVSMFLVSRKEWRAGSEPAKAAKAPEPEKPRLKMEDFEHA